MEIQQFIKEIFISDHDGHGYVHDHVRGHGYDHARDHDDHAHCDNVLCDDYLHVCGLVVYGDHGCEHAFPHDCG